MLSTVRPPSTSGDAHRLRETGSAPGFAGPGRCCRDRKPIACRQTFRWKADRGCPVRRPTQDIRDQPLSLHEAGHIRITSGRWDTVGEELKPERRGSRKD